MSVKNLNLKKALACVAAIGLLPNASFANGNVMGHHPDIGGHAAFNTYVDDTGHHNKATKRKWTNTEFDQMRLHAKGHMDGIHYKVEYGLFDGYRHPLDLHASYDFSNRLTGFVGNTTVPFGILPKEGHSWWQGMPFYTGFADNHSVGFKTMYSNDPWDFQVQLGLAPIVKDRDAGSWAPKLTTGAVASTGVVTADGVATEANEQGNNIVARVAHTHVFNNNCNVEVGLSAKLGRQFNNVSARRGSNWAGALHLNGNWHNFNLQLQALPYRYSLENGSGANSNTVQLGSANTRYTIPAKANIYSGGISYDFHVHWGKIHNIKVFYDYSQLSSKDTIKKSKMGTLGAAFVAGPLHVSADIISGKNMRLIGEQDGTIHNIGSANTARGDDVDHYKTKLNINVGVYF